LHAYHASKAFRGEVLLVGRVFTKGMNHLMIAILIACVCVILTTPGTNANALGSELNGAYDPENEPEAGSDWFGSIIFQDPQGFVEKESLADDPLGINSGDTGLTSDLLSGFVMDSHERPIQGARVVVAYHILKRVGYSDEFGHYSITTPQVSDSKREITVSKEGYQDLKTEIFIHENTVLNVKLEKEDSLGKIRNDFGIPIGILFSGILAIMWIRFLRGNKKYILLSHLAFPLYTKIPRDGVLTQRTRKELFSYLADNPGSNFSKMLRELDLGTSSLVHHLQVLEREGIIRSRKELGRRLFFPKGMVLPPYHGNSSLPPSPIQRVILRHLEEYGPCSSSGIIKDLSLKRSTVNYSLHRLKDRGMIRSHIQGKQAYYQVIE